MALMTRQQAYRLPALKLAFVGDTVCDLLIRTELMFRDDPVRETHRSATQVVNARAQASQLDAVDHLLNTDERDVVQRARNAHPAHSLPQAASREEYMKATAFKALMGYLYLSGQMRRAQTLFQLGRVKE